MSGLFEGIGGSVDGVIAGGASGVVQGLPGAVAGGAAGGAIGAAAGASVGVLAGAGTGGVTIPVTGAAGVAGGAVIGSAVGAGAGFAPGFSQGYRDGYGPGSAIGGGYGRAVDDTWLGKKLNAMVKGHDAADRGIGNDQALCVGQCLASEASDDLEKRAKVKQETKGKTRHGRLPGTMADADREFDQLGPRDVKPINTQYGPGRTGIIDSSSGFGQDRVVVRPGNSGNPKEPSLDIQRPNGRNTEIRFGT